jgi:multimeric flavodoxin WrbA
MKKIIAVIGSPNDQKSNTCTMVRDFIDTVKQYYPDIESEIISLGTHKVEPCHGCWNCFKTGQCVYKNDSLPEIREKILNCDFLIIGTPVYEQAVTGQTKILIDRLMMWIHLIGLMGKPTITAVTSGGDGIKPCQKYLNLVVQFMGCILVGQLEGLGLQPGCFPEREKYIEKYQYLARNTASILSGKKEAKPRKMNERAFEQMKQHMLCATENSEENNSTENTAFEWAYERKYWQEKGWLTMTYQEALQAEKSLHQKRG